MKPVAEQKWDKLMASFDRVRATNEYRIDGHVGDILMIFARDELAHNYIVWRDEESAILTREEEYNRTILSDLEPKIQEYTMRGQSQCADYTLASDKAAQYQKEYDKAARRVDECVAKIAALSGESIELFPDWSNSKFTSKGVK